ncbi:MAG: class I SAM-dependent RNA methyltransferase [Candidatus Melainabacteria bacterium]
MTTQYTTPPNTDTRTLTVEKLVAGGEGLCRQADGPVVFAAGVAPGDVIEGVPVREKGRWVMADWRLIAAGPGRVAPACRHAGVCGGCDWQHLSRETLEASKTELVRECLTRIGKIADPPVLPILSPKAWHGRNTVTWWVAEDNGRKRLAYRARASHDPVFFEECPVLTPALYAHAVALNAAPDALPETGREVRARSNGNGDVADTLNGPPTLTVHLGGKDYRCGVPHFMQSNLLSTDVLIGLLRDAMSATPDAGTILDLYCGIGILGLSVLSDAQQLTGVEGDTEAIDRARENALALGADAQTEWLAEAVESYVRANPDASFDVAITDPPRNGMKPEVLAWLAAHVQQAILYVSCDPATLARDVGILSQNGWTLASVQPVDMFPQTSHVECLAILKRSL